MAAARESVLISFAVLSANWNEAQHSYLRTFEPFIAAVLEDAPDRSATAAELSESIESRFGIPIPINVVKGILRRARSDSLIVRKGELAVLNPGVQLPSTYRARRATADAEFTALIDSFEQFALDNDTHIGRFGLGHMLESFLLDRTLPMLRAVVRNEPPTYDDTPNQTASDYLTAAFISHISVHEPETFGYLSNIVKGSVVATTLYLDNRNELADLKGLKVFVDTALIIDHLGLRTKTHTDAATDMLDLATELGAELCCFDHTAEELAGVLQSIGRNLEFTDDDEQQADRMYILQVAIDRGWRRADFLKMAAQVDQLLADKGYTIVDTGDIAYAPDDRGELDNHLADALGQREVPRRRDVRSLLAIRGLRRGEHIYRLERSRAVLVTKNTGLADASRRYFHEDDDDRIVPVCVLDHELTIQSWLRRPLARPDLPERQILTACAAAVFPTKQLWNKYLTTIEELRDRGEELDENDVIFLRFGAESIQTLMQRSKGDPDTVTIETIREVISRTRSGLTPTERDELQNQLNDLRSRVEGGDRDAVIDVRDDDASPAGVAADDAPSDSQTPDGASGESLKDRWQRLSIPVELSLKVVTTVVTALVALTTAGVIVIQNTDGPDETTGGSPPPTVMRVEPTQHELTAGESVVLENGAIEIRLDDPTPSVRPMSLTINAADEACQVGELRAGAVIVLPVGDPPLRYAGVYIKNVYEDRRIVVVDARTITEPFEWGPTTDLRIDQFGVGRQWTDLPPGQQSPEPGQQSVVDRRGSRACTEVAGD